MYNNLHYGLDTPPPASRFQRPWSPDPYDPLPSASRTPHDDYFSSHPLLQRREPSDVSVEALDLADYAATLHRNNMRDRPAYDFRPYDAYPPTPPSGLLRSPQSAYTPSLASPSSNTSHSLPTSRGPRHRPFSLPPTSNYPPIRPTAAMPSFSDASNRLHDPPSPAPNYDDEIDIGRFPAFTQGWYDKTGAGHALPPSSPALSAGGEKMSPFDPTYPSPYSRSPPPSYPYDLSSQSRSSRDQSHLPWGAEGDGAPLDPEVKEERVRMLEREFATAAPEAAGETKVGSVDVTGRLITDGPKKRAAVRWLQALLALTAAVASIYAALVIKPATKPPPQGKLPIYILYVLSVLSFLATTYVFLIYPCCCGARQKNDKNGLPFQGPNGLMVLPVQSLPGGAQANKKKRGKKGQGGQESVQVNLIVDPGLFGGREREEEWDDGEGTVPGTFDGSVSGSGRARRTAGRRRGVFEGLAMEAEWKRARKLLKWGMALDMLSVILWGAEFVLIMMGSRCPSSEYDGWCESYNVASAAACLLALAFGISIFFDIKDLHASKASPRTRT